MRITIQELRCIGARFYASIAKRRDVSLSVHPLRVFGARYSASASHLIPINGVKEHLEEEENGRRIRGAVLKVRNCTVEEVVESLRGDQSCSRVKLTHGLVDQLLSKFGDDWKSALGLFRWASSHSGYEHSRRSYDKMVDLLGKMKQMSRMWDLIGEMHRGGHLTLDTVAKIMRRLAGAGKWKEAIKVFDDLESMGIDKNTESMNLLLDTLCKEKKVEVAREVFIELKAHIPPSAHTFNIFVHGWCSARRIEEAMWTIQEMKGFGFRPSVITYSTILQAYCNQSNFRRAYELLDEMVAEGCPPNVVTYTTFMLSLSRSGEFIEAMNLVDRMKLSGCKPDILFYNTFVNILGRAGRLEEAAHIFNVEMLMNGVHPNLSTYNTMISIFCNHYQEERALNVLKEMEHSGCTPDLYTYRPLLKLCFNSGMTDDQLHSLLSDIIDKHHLGLDLDSYTLLIHGLCRKGKTKWACVIFEEMLGQEIVPNNRTCHLIMREAELRGMYDLVERTKSLMKRSNDFP